MRFWASATKVCTSLLSSLRLLWDSIIYRSITPSKYLNKAQIFLHHTRLSAETNVDEDWQIVHKYRLFWLIIVFSLLVYDWRLPYIKIACFMQYLIECAARFNTFPQFGWRDVILRLIQLINSRPNCVFLRQWIILDKIVEGWELN